MLPRSLANYRSAVTIQRSWPHLARARSGTKHYFLSVSSAPHLHLRAMSVNIALPNLQNWAELRLNALLNATTEETFDEAFDGFLSKDVKITFNGGELSRNEYKKQLQQQTVNEAGAQVQFGGVVGVNTALEAGAVGLFYTATIVQNSLVLGTPSESQVNSSMNLFIKVDKSIHPPHLPPGVHGDFDGRRVFTLNQVSLGAPVDGN
uniref:Uncharacterized protein n=1 Tax=Mycena chlorophos TaxID=658473 RepID=A0ABQ0LWB5_MYCCL|nr:predicted protein [Mycena chlorophos]